MRAAVYREFCGPIRVEDNVPIPKVTSDGVLVEVKATGVCRSDWHGWKGHDADVVKHGLPFIPGHEFSGIVAEVGCDVTRFKVGDRVAIPFILSCGECHCCRQDRPTVCIKQKQPGFTQWGSFAEFVAIPRADRNLEMLPRDISFVQAAALGCRFTTAYRALIRQGRLQEGDTIAIFGCGGVGMACVMIAVAQKASKIIAIDVSEHALEKAKELGATHTVHHDRNGTVSATQSKVKELTAFNDGADLCVDAAGVKSTCENAIHCTKRSGRMVQVGLPIDRTSPPEVPMGLVVAREIEVVGSHGFGHDELVGILSMVTKGLVDPTRLIGREVDLYTGAKEIENMDEGSPLGITVITNFGKSSL